MRYLVRTTYDTTEEVLIPALAVTVNAWVADGKIVRVAEVESTATQHIVTRECSSRENADAWANELLSFFQAQPETAVHPSLVTVVESK